MGTPRTHATIKLRKEKKNSTTDGGMHAFRVAGAKRKSEFSKM
jgi:hypothetical protein